MIPERFERSSCSTAWCAPTGVAGSMSVVIAGRMPGSQVGFIVVVHADFGNKGWCFCEMTKVVEPPVPKTIMGFGEGFWVFQ